MTTLIDVINLCSKVKAPAELAAVVVGLFTLLRMYQTLLKWDKMINVNAAKYDGQFKVLAARTDDNTKDIEKHERRLTTMETILLIQKRGGESAKKEKG